MATIVYKIWCEWDVGEGDIVFSSEEKAMEWLAKNPILTEEILNPDDGISSMEDLLDQGLVSIQEIELDPE